MLVSSLRRFFGSPPTRRPYVRRDKRRARLFLETLEDRITPSALALLATDQPDYAPGATATFLGTGFEVGENVNISIAADNGNSESIQVTDGGANDLDGSADGNFTVSWLVDPNGAYLDATVTATASGDQGSFASTTFTDHGPSPVTDSNYSITADSFFVVTVSVDLGGGSDTVTNTSGPLTAATAKIANVTLGGTIDVTLVAPGSSDGNGTWTGSFQGDCETEYKINNINVTWATTDVHQSTVTPGGPPVSVTTDECPAGNSPPTCDDDDVDVNEDDGAIDVTATLLDGDTDPDFDTLTVSAIDTTTNSTIGSVLLSGGVVTYDPNGQFEYLAEDETATDSFLYTVSDGNGGSDICTVTVTIHGQNDDPTITSLDLDPDEIDEGDSTTLTVNWTDPDLTNTFTVTIDWGDGSDPEVNLLASSGDTYTHTYVDDDPTGTSSDDYEIDVTVTDNDDGFDTDYTILTVNNVDPTLSVDESSIIQDDCHTTFSVAGTFSDLGADSYKVVIDWDDGNTTEYTLFTYPGPETDGEAGTFDVTGEHTYAAFGTYTISVSVVDDDDGSDSETVGTVTVAATASVTTGDPDWGTVLDIHGTDLRDVITVNQNVENSVQVLKVHANSWDDPQTFVIGTGSTAISLIRIHLCDGDDQASISSGAKVGALVYGEAGNDHINAGKVLGTSILIGGDDDDDLVGGAGNDLLIGGDGSDRIVGGNGDDLIIAGYTSYDTGNEAALKAILTAWNTGLATSYSAGIAAIQTGTYALQTDGPDQNVFSDGYLDRLTGSSGNDVFFANTDGGDDAVKDIITDASKLETASGLLDIDLT